MVNDFLFELGCEELPSASVRPLAESLLNHLLASLEQAQLVYKTAHFYATARRLAVLITDLQEKQPAQTHTRKGPHLAVAYDKEGQPTQALLGFARSCGVAVSDLVLSKTEKGEWFSFESTTEGLQTRDLFPQLIRQALASLPIAKPMRWGDQETLFVRPVHWAVLLCGNEVISTEILGIKTDRYSYGHRFHHPQAIEIKHPKQYEIYLKEAFVIADFQTRRALIKKQIEELALKHEAKAIIPEVLLDEVTSIVEWPQALLANFSAGFLTVPPEVIIASMQSHQKCFALQDPKGQLLPSFITVSNISSKNPEKVILGNEKVMRARLQDAVFFYQQDKKKALEHFITDTEKVIFQKGLGSLYEKSKRIQILMHRLSNPLECDENDASRAAELSKCDLMTGMVGEFPELQGLMGYYYAKNSGENDLVALALKEQYLPRFSGDELPSSPLGLALSLTDRLDTLTGVFLLGHKPSGVKDPFKLRRHALAIGRLLINTSAPLSLSSLIREAIQLHASLNVEASFESIIHEFILERLQSFYQSNGITSDLFHAVRARQADWLYDLDKRIKALAEFKRLPEAFLLSTSCKRVGHILEQAGFDSARSPQLQEDLLQEPAEKSLFLSIVQIKQKVSACYLTNDYTTILKEITKLHDSINAFFDTVMVMVDNEAIKTNRLQLLFQLQSLLQGVADIGLLQL